jgi:hypothetical protein
MTSVRSFSSLLKVCANLTLGRKSRNSMYVPAALRQAGEIPALLVHS